jgi:hypothetical protein
MPGGGNCMPPGGEPAGPPGGANPGGRPCGRAGIPACRSQSHESQFVFPAFILTRWEAGHARRRCKSWWQTLWKRRHAYKASVFNVLNPYVHSKLHTSRKSRRQSTRRHRKPSRHTRRHTSRETGRSKTGRRSVQHRVVRRLSLGRV